MKEAAVIVIDAGTGDCRVAAFSDKGEPLASAHREWTYQSGREGIPGAFAFDPEGCWRSVKELLQAVTARAGCAAAVTVTSQRDGMAFLDREGRELYCAPNMDLRGEAALPALRPFCREILERTGLPLHALFGLSRLTWHRDFAPEVYERIDCVLMLCDWLAFRLCGERRSERAAASSSQMLSLRSGEYDRALMERLGLRGDLFPRTCGAAEAVGGLLPGVARETGLKAGVPVFIGGSDAHCGAVGTGCLRSGETAVIAGTTTPVLSFFDRPVVDKRGALYGSLSSLPGLWALEANADSTGLSYRWVRDLFFPGKADAFRRMEAEARTVPPGSGGMKAYIGVGIRGEEKGCNLGGFLFPVPWNISDFGRAHFLRAALESNAFGTAANLEALWASGAEKPELLHLCGGQSRSPLWAGMLADTAGVAVQTYENAEATALGAALLAAYGVGLYPTVRAAAEAFVRPGRRYASDPDSPYPALYRQWRERRRHLLELSCREEP